MVKLAELLVKLVVLEELNEELERLVEELVDALVVAALEELLLVDELVDVLVDEIVETCGVVEFVLTMAGVDIADSVGVTLTSGVVLGSREDELDAMKAGCQ